MDKQASHEYRQLLVRSIHQCTVKYPSVAGVFGHFMPSRPRPRLLIPPAVLERRHEREDRTITRNQGKLARRNLLVVVDRDWVAGAELPETICL